MADYTYTIAEFTSETEPTIDGLIAAVASSLGLSCLVSYQFTGDTPEVPVTLTHVVFSFDSSLDSGEESTLDGLVATYVNPAVSLVGKRTHVCLTADASVTSTPADVTGWTDITLDANAYYSFSMVMQFSNSAAGVAGPGVGFFFTNTPTNFCGLVYAMVTTSTDSDRALLVDTIGSTGNVTNANEKLPMIVSGTFKTGATPGTMKIQSSCGAANTATIYAGSVISLEIVG